MEELKNVNEIEETVEVVTKMPKGQKLGLAVLALTLTVGAAAVIVKKVKGKKEEPIEVEVVEEDSNEESEN